MIKCRVIENFTLEDYDKLKNIKRNLKKANKKLYVGDTFECDKKMVEYLTGSNIYNKKVIKIIEVNGE